MLVILQIIVLILNIIQTRCKNTQKMLVLTLSANIVTFFTYFVNTNYIGAVIYSVTIIRSIVYVYKSKFKTDYPCYLMLALQLLVIMVTIDEPIEALNATAGLYSCYYMWFYTTASQFRAGFIINNSLRLVYELYNGLYVLVIMRTISIVSAAYNNIKEKLNNTKNVRKEV